MPDRKGDMAILPYLEDGFRVTGIAMGSSPDGSDLRKPVSAQDSSMNALPSEFPAPQRRAQHCGLARESWARLQTLKVRKRVEIDGESLEVASVVAVAKYVSTQAFGAMVAGVYTKLFSRYDCEPSLDCSRDLTEKIEKSCKALEIYLDKGYTAYGNHSRALQIRVTADCVLRCQYWLWW